MSDRQRGRPPEHEDEELIEAVARACQKADSPVVNAQDVASQLEIQADSARPRLQQLASDKKLGIYRTDGQVFWVPDKGEEGGEIDYTALDEEFKSFDDIKPEETPIWFARAAAEAKLPEHGGDGGTRWQRSYHSASSALETVAILFAIGFSILLLDTTLFEFDLPTVLTNVVAVFVALSIILSIILVGMMVVSYGAQWLKQLDL